MKWELPQLTKLQGECSGGGCLAGATASSGTGCTAGDTALGGGCTAGTIYTGGGHCSAGGGGIAT